MNNDTALLVIQICADIGLEVRSYSGRGMYGDQCVGVTGSNTHQILAQIIIGLCELGADGVEAADHFTRDGAVRSDSLGMDGIVYFPRLPWVDQCDSCGDYDCQRPACREEEALARFSACSRRSDL